MKQPIGTIIDLDDGNKGNLCPMRVIDIADNEIALEQIDDETRTKWIKRYKPAQIKHWKAIEAGDVDERFNLFVDRSDLEMANTLFTCSHDGQLKKGRIINCNKDTWRVDVELLDDDEKEYYILSNLCAAEFKMLPLSKLMKADKKLIAEIEGKFNSYSERKEKPLAAKFMYTDASNIKQQIYAFRETLLVLFGVGNAARNERYTMRCSAPAEVFQGLVNVIDSHCKLVKVCLGNEHGDSAIQKVVGLWQTMKDSSIIDEAKLTVKCLKQLEDQIIEWKTGNLKRAKQ